MKIQNKAITLLFVLSFGLVVAAYFNDHKPGKTIGIDLGSSYTRVSVYTKRHTVEIIPNDETNNTVTPSWVAFNDINCLIGEPTKSQAAVNAERSIFDVKRLMGKMFDDPEVQRDVKLLPYKVVNKDGKPCIEMKVNGETKVFSPEEITASYDVEEDEGNS